MALGTALSQGSVTFGEVLWQSGENFSFNAKVSALE
jgi:hypothetical protein